MIERLLYKSIEDKLFKGKIVVLAGARQVGKTTLLKQILRNKEGVLWLNGDEMQVQNLFNNASADRLLSEFGNNKIVILDEAQRIKDIGLRLKLIADADCDITAIVVKENAPVGVLPEPLYDGEVHKSHIFTGISADIKRINYKTTNVHSPFKASNRDIL